MKRRPLLSRLQRLASPYARDKKRGVPRGTLLNHPDFNDFQERAWEIMENFIWRPGDVIVVGKGTLAEEMRQFIGEFWDEAVNRNVIWEKMTSGELGGLFSYLGDEYAKRAVRLKPLVLPRGLSEELRVYYQEAIQCWVHGLNAAAIILLGSVIEEVLCVVLDGSAPNLRRKRIGELIAMANSKRLLNGNTTNTLRLIYHLRNRATHERSGISETQVFDAIMSVQQVIWDTSK
ncbi:MAG: hypothetical protein ABSH14_12910 [Verrucomicrobiia bacterium]